MSQPPPPPPVVQAQQLPPLAKLPPPPAPTNKGQTPPTDDKRWAWLQPVAIVASFVCIATGAVWAIGAKIDETRKDLGAKIDENRRELSGRIDETRKDVTELRADVARQGGVLTQLDVRLTRVENKLGLPHDPDAGTEEPDAGPAAHTWTPSHVGRRQKFCVDLCKGDEACCEKCSADYNACGIKCPSEPTSDCFRICVGALRRR